jgi:hypothetical protein
VNLPRRELALAIFAQSDKGKLAWIAFLGESEAAAKQ